MRLIQGMFGLTRKYRCGAVPRPATTALTHRLFCDEHLARFETHRIPATPTRARRADSYPGTQGETADTAKEPPTDCRASSRPLRASGPRRHGPLTSRTNNNVATLAAIAQECRRRGRRWPAETTQHMRVWAWNRRLLTPGPSHRLVAFLLNRHRLATRTCPDVLGDSARFGWLHRSCCRSRHRFQPATCRISWVARSTTVRRSHRRTRAPTATIRSLRRWRRQAGV
jgi:hypothetical protein